MLKSLKKAPTTALPIVAGAIGAKLVKNLSGKFVQNDKVKAAIPLVLGIILMGGKSKALHGVGAGMVAVGGADLAGSFVPALAGIEDMDLSGVLNGDGDFSMNGDDMAGVLNGDDDMSGYDDQY